MASKRRKLRLVHSAPVLSSDPTPERVLRSGGYFEEGKDGRGATITTFHDYPLAVAHRDGIVSKRQFEAGEKYHQHWFSAGLAGTVPTIFPGNPISIDGEFFAGPPQNDWQRYHRGLVRDAWKAMGYARGHLVESGVCWQWPVAWDSSKMQWALNSLANHWNLPK